MFPSPILKTPNKMDKNYMNVLKYEKIPYSHSCNGLPCLVNNPEISGPKYEYM